MLPARPIASTTARANILLFFGASDFFSVVSYSLTGLITSDSILFSLVVGPIYAIGVWLGGLVALGAIAAPVVFAIVPMPASADAMTVVFRRFDLVAMACAAVAIMESTACTAGSASV